MALFNSTHSIADFLLNLSSADLDTITRHLNEWNPWQDVTIDELQLLKANIVAEYRVRSGSILRTYWRRLSFDELVFAEAEAAYLKDLFIVVDRLIDLHLQTEYLDKDCAEFDKWVESGRIHKDMARERAIERKFADLVHGAESRGNVQVLSDDDVGEGMAMHGALLSLLPGRFNVHAEYRDWLELPSFTAEPEILTEPVTIRAQQELILWRESLADMQSQFHSSWARFVMDLINHRHMNLVEGRNPDNRLVLADAGIPHPKPDSFLGWFGHSGIAFRKLAFNESMAMKRVCHFTPESILTYMLPALPMTKEHVSYTLVQTADSTADHSLSSRSKAHKRDDNGRILFGQWRVRTVLLGESGAVYTVADEALSSLDRRPMAIHEQHLSMLPEYRSTLSAWARGGQGNRDIFFPGRTIDEVGDTTGFLTDPSIRGSTVPVPWALFARSIGLPWASLAQQHKIHFRFNWSLEGLEAASLWANHFEQAAWQWARASPGQRKAWQFKTLVEHTRYIRGHREEVVTHGKAGDTKFDLSWLN